MQKYQKNIAIVGGFVLVLAGVNSISAQKETLIIQESPLIVQTQVGNTIIRKEKVGGLTITTTNRPILKIQKTKTLYPQDEIRVVRSIRDVRPIRPVKSKTEKFADNMEKALSSEAPKSETDKLADNIEKVLSK